MSALHKLMARIEQAEALDKVAQPVAGLVGRLVKPRPVRNILSGSYLGHPLHPLMTDLPIGAWTMSTLLDTVGGRRAEPAADLLVTAGILTAAPTAWAGLNDWSDTQGGTAGWESCMPPPTRRHWSASRHHWWPAAAAIAAPPR